MKRRDFCRSALAASAAAAYPFMTNAVLADASVAAVSLDGAEIEIEKSAIREFAGALDGTLLMPGDAQYDYARQVWNGMHDRRPALIARCTSDEDVRHAVTFANERDLLLCVAPRHAVHGRATFRVAITHQLRLQL